MVQIHNLAASALEKLFIVFNAIPLIFAVLGAVACTGILLLGLLAVVFSSVVSDVIKEIIPFLLIGFLNLALLFVAYMSIKTYTKKKYEWWWVACIMLLLPLCLYTAQFVSLESSRDRNGEMAASSIITFFVFFLPFFLPQIFYIQKKRRVLTNSFSTTP